MLFLRLAPKPAGRKRQKASCGGRFVCGTLDASRQGDGGTVLNSIKIADGVGIDNLLAADVGSLASIVIPDIPGVDAHNCRIKGKSNAKIEIGDRDFLNNLQTDWGNTEHLCLYGNGIVYSRNGSIRYAIQSHTTPLFRPGSGFYNSANNTWGDIVGGKCLNYKADCPGGFWGNENRAHIWVYDPSERLLVEKKSSSFKETWTINWGDGYGVSPEQQAIKFKTDVDESNSNNTATWSLALYPFGEDPQI